MFSEMDNYDREHSEFAQQYQSFLYQVDPQPLLVLAEYPRGLLQPTQKGISEINITKTSVYIPKLVNNLSQLQKWEKKI